MIHRFSDPREPDPAHWPRDGQPVSASAVLRQTLVGSAAATLPPPTGGGVRTTVSHRIFALASLIEPDPIAAWQWFMCTPLITSGGMTACELLFTGQGDRVIAFLRHALADQFAETTVVPCRTMWSPTNRADSRPRLTCPR